MSDRRPSGGENANSPTSGQGPEGPRGQEQPGVPDVPELQCMLAEFAAARDWEQYHTPKNLVAALSVEASELLEIFQWLTPEQSADVMTDPRTAHRVEDEIADVLSYLLQLCTVLGVDPRTAVAAKIERNETRFPRSVPPTDS